jgi:hypothetical protein
MTRPAALLYLAAAFAGAFLAWGFVAAWRGATDDGRFIGYCILAAEMILRHRETR